MEKIVLFKLEGPTIKISMQLYFNHSGQLIFDGYDIGKGVEFCWGDSDYEYTYTIEPSSVDRLYSVLKVLPGDRKSLLLELKKRFGNNTGYSDFGKFMTKNKIAYKPFTWT
jgi:hypothetical protein